MSLGPTTLGSAGEKRVSSETSAFASRGFQGVQDLGGEALEECSGTLVLDEIANDSHAPDLGLEILVLDAGLLAGRIEGQSKARRHTQGIEAHLDHVKRL